MHPYHMHKIYQITPHIALCSISALMRFSLSHKPTSTPFPLSATSSYTSYQIAIQHDTAQPLTQQEITRIQQIIGCLFYYAHALYNTLHVALNIIS